MTKEAKSRKRRFKLPKPRAITLPGKDFQPSKADMDREYDVPEASLKTIRSAFFRPFNIRREAPE